jgi:hypothetical protein
MARRRGRPAGERDDVSVKLDRAVVGKARAVATHEGTTLAEFLTEMVRGQVDRKYAQMLRELEASEKVTH